MEDFGKLVKQYLKYFRVLGIITACVFVLFLVVMNIHKKDKMEYYESTNSERVYGEQRVFDYGNQLTDEEEESLEEYIHEAEKKTCLDIVIVTLNQSLKDYEPEYRAKYDMTITPDKYVMVYADKFWEDNKFGYNCPQKMDGRTDTGDGVLLVDNIYREEETGKIYTWMCTTGRAEEEYSSGMIDHALDCFYDEVDENYYEACKDFVDCVVSDMEIESNIFLKYGESIVGIMFLGIITAFIFCAVHWRSSEAVVTVTPETYLNESGIKFPVRRDTFLRKTVTKHYNPPSSSGSHGGGGSHISGGGGSHGGGGHSR